MREMENISEKKVCPRADEIITYIYNEIEHSQRLDFEAHIADCMSCTDEFAAVSDARYSVFEWRKEAFAELPTPEISIPYKNKTAAMSGFFASIGEMVRTAGWLAPAAAAIVLFAGIGFVMFTVLGVGDGDLAKIDVENTPTEVESPQLFDEKAPAISNAEEKTLPESEKPRTVSQAKPVRSVERSAMKVSSQKNQKPRNARATSPTVVKAPVLSNYEENVDRSLRLSDLLAEVGG